MGWRARQGPGVRRMGRGIPGTLVLILLGAPAHVGAGDLSAIVTSSINSSEVTAGGDSSSQQSFVNSLDMNYNRTMTPMFSYRLRLFAEEGEASTSARDVSVRSSAWQVQPEGDLTLSGPKYSMNVGARFRDTYSDQTRAGSFNQMQDFEFVRAFIMPDRLPSLNLQFQHEGLQDNESPSTQDVQRTRGIVNASYTLAEKLSLAYTFTRDTEDNNVSGLSREQLSQIGNVTYTDAFFGDRLSVNGNYLISWLKTNETFSPTTIGGVAAAPIVLSGAFSLTETDPAVAAASKVPPLTYTVLTSSAGTSLGFTAPLVVDQGGNPSQNQSIAFGLSPGTSVTTIRLTVSSRPGDSRDLPLQAQAVSFQVLVGRGPNINLTAWTPVAVVAVTPPTAVNPFFEIAIPSTSGTFLKIHVAGDTQQPTLPPLVATGVSALGPVAAGGTTNQASTTNLLQTVTATITAQPIQDLNLTATGNFSTNEQDVTNRRDSNGTYSVTATATPHPLLTVTGAYQGGFTSSNDPQTPGTQNQNASLTLSSTPLPTLTSVLIGSWGENELGGAKQNQTTSVSFNSTLVPYRNLNVDMTVQGTQGENFVDNSKVRAFSFSTNANSQLTRRLGALMGYTFSTAEVTGGPSPSSLLSNSGYLSLTYTLSRFLDLIGRWDFTLTDQDSIVTQTYRLNILPTLKTSVILAYIRVDRWGPSAPGSTDTASLNATWNISRYFDLSGFATFTHRSNGDSLYTISGTLTFRL